MCHVRFWSSVKDGKVSCAILTGATVAHFPWLAAAGAGLLELILPLRMLFPWILCLCLQHLDLHICFAHGTSFVLTRPDLFVRHPGVLLLQLIKFPLLPVNLLLQLVPLRS